MRRLTLILGILGCLAALAGVWNLFPSWLSLLGIFVPPIGAIIILDQLGFKSISVGRDPVPYRSQAFIAWGIGSGVSLAFHFLLPQYGEALVALFVSAGVYVALATKRTRVSPVALAD